ncbi:MAG: hypothetical protein BRC23_01645 [Parcubacteria group bacterium SW_4_49_11]|nr:MAG: hypothetical protein BRC23_01645 [Parcubacteria group bacterium SW_4_49_11]
MTELSILVVLIILVGLGLFIIISKVASTPDPEEDEEDGELFERKSVKEDKTEQYADSEPEPNESDSAEEEVAKEPESKPTPFASMSQALRERSRNGKQRVGTWISSVWSTGGSRIANVGRYSWNGVRTKSARVVQFARVRIEAVLKNAEQSEQSEQEEDSSAQDSPENETDTSFLEKPSSHKSFSTFETNLEEDDLSDETEEAEETQDSSEEEREEPPKEESPKVDTFVQSMLEETENTSPVQSPQPQAETESNPSAEEPEPPAREEEASAPTQSDIQGDDHLRRLEEKYLKMIVNDPQNIDSYRRLGNLYLAMEQYHDARETFTHILRLQKDDKRANDKLQEIDRILKQNSNL